MMVGMEPVRVEALPQIDYIALEEYLRSWPDKLAAFTCDHLADSEYHAFVHDLFCYCCEDDKDGPDFREWVQS